MVMKNVDFVNRSKMYSFVCFSCHDFKFCISWSTNFFVLHYAFTVLLNVESISLVTQNTDLNLLRFVCPKQRIKFPFQLPYRLKGQTLCEEHLFITALKKFVVLHCVSKSSSSPAIFFLQVQLFGIY